MASYRAANTEGSCLPETFLSFGGLALGPQNVHAPVDSLCAARPTLTQMTALQICIATRLIHATTASNARVNPTNRANVPHPLMLRRKIFDLNCHFL